MADKIKLKDVGPIRELEIALAPGVTELVGENGVGKSKALEAVEALTAGSGKLKPRDGTLGGEVEGFGIRLSVGHSTRRFGDPEFVSIGDKLDVATLVEPGLKSPEANDAARIKALVGLTGVTADAEAFHELVGGAEEFEKLVKKASIVPDDPVEMARRVKKDLEEASRLEQSNADHAEGHASAKTESAKALGEEVEGLDPAALQKAFKDAVSTEARMQSTAEQAKQAAIDLQTAKEGYLEASKAYDGPTVAEAEADLEVAGKNAANAQLLADEATAALSKAEQIRDKALEELRTAKHNRDHATDRLNLAKQAIAVCEKWEKQIADIVVPEAPTDEDLQKAATAVAEARKAIEDSVVAGKIKGLLDEAREAAEKAKGHQAKADRLRNSAKAVESILSKLIAKAGCTLTVVGTEKGPRLVTETPRGQTLYAELSDGQRWRLAMEIGLDTFKRMIETDNLKGVPIFPLPQRAWQDLDPENRQAIADLARERKVRILTARCDSGPLRIEVL